MAADPNAVWLALIGGLGTAFALVVSGLLAVVQRLLRMLADAHVTNAKQAATNDRTLSVVERLPDKEWFLERQGQGVQSK